MRNIHPIRAALAVAVVGATIYMWVTGVSIQEGQWVALGAVIAYYFASTKENQ